MTLEKVVGMTVTTQNSVAVNPLNGDLCYTAGCFVVIYSPKDNKQIRHLSSRTSRAIQCLAFARSGNYLAIGENAFRQPEITIFEFLYDDQNRTSSIAPVKHLKGHKYGIEALRFSLNGDYLVSLGEPNDRGLFVWDWQQEKKVSSNKLSKPVTCLAFSDAFFVTAGY